MKQRGEVKRDWRSAEVSTSRIVVAFQDLTPPSRPCPSHSRAYDRPKYFAAASARL
jgi:hypothetical protein